MNEIHANIKLFLDNTSLYLIVEHLDVTAQLLNIDLETMANRAKLWLVTFNPTKSESLLISQKVNAPIQPPIFMNNQQLTEVTSHKHLGLHIPKDCTWHEQIILLWKRLGYELILCVNLNSYWIVNHYKLLRCRKEGTT